MNRRNHNNNKNHRPTGSGGRGGGHHRPPQQESHHHPNYAYNQNPNFQFQNQLLQNIAALASSNNFQFQNPNFQFQNPNFSLQQQHYYTGHIANHQQLPAKETQVFSSSKRPALSLQRVEDSVAKAKHTLIAAGEHVSAWKVAQSTLLDLKMDSWSSLGFAMQEVPSLGRLIITEARINAFIHCFIAVQSITSLFDLEEAIRKNEGAKHYHELELGPFLRHPLVLHYFPLNSDDTDVIKITSEEIITYLCEFMDTREKREIKTDEFLDFIAKKKCVMGKEKLGIRIQTLGKLNGLLFNCITSGGVRLEALLGGASLLFDFLNCHVDKGVLFSEWQKIGLNFRIASSTCIIRMHISFISEARRMHDSPLKKYLKKSTGSGKRQRRPLFNSDKQSQDERFNTIRERFKTFSSEHPDFRGKHIRFASSSSEDEDSQEESPVQNINGSGRVSSCRYPSTGEEMARHGMKGEMDTHLSPIESSVQNVSSTNWVSSCPYPSVREEISRLGLKDEMDGQVSSVSGHQNVKSASLKKKRKYQNISNSGSEPTKILKKECVEQDVCSLENGSDMKKDRIFNEADVSLSDSSMKMFIATWKETCIQHNVTEVLERMLQISEPKDSKKASRRRKKVNFLISSYPLIALLNVAVASIKLGMWDSIYDTIQAIGQHGSVDSPPHMHPKYETIDVEPSGKNVPVVVGMQTPCVTVEEVINKVKTHFELDDGMQSTGTSHIEKSYFILKKLYKCECWLAEEFCVKEFNSLGFGEFLFFVEKHASQLPIALQNFLTGSDKVSLVACMAEHILFSLICQASSSLWEREKVTKQMIATLLMRQFPLLSFKIVESRPIKSFLDAVEILRNNTVSKCVLFSATLLETSFSEETLPRENYLSETIKVKTNTGHKMRVSQSVTSKDAIEVMCRAPMLSDLVSWSHWDLLFAPSLGSLIGWLLNDVHDNDLLCVATKEGQVIRIDHSATVESFLEVALQGLPFQTAVKLLSVFSLSGGKNHVPLSLLKCHARHAFEVMFKNHLGDLDVHCGEDSLVCGEAFYQGETHNEHATDIFSGGMQNLVNIKNVSSVAARFILECLSYLPSEFRGFAADVLLSGMRSVIKNAPLAILQNCNQKEGRLMLHDIGLSIGIVEWIDDYHVFCETASHNDLLQPSEAACMGAAGSEVITRQKCMEVTLDKYSGTEKDSNIPARTFQATKDLEVPSDRRVTGCTREENEVAEDLDATLVIESIRREEFGLDQNISDMECRMLKKQHARLGRALHCLSQELYSQDSHFLLELVQNADDNLYPENVEPTLAFILQDSQIVVLNNEEGFSAQNMRALCDVGNSTKKGSGAGYIGQKGIGFKSVFRVTDAPQIHSNGFHVKFDISEGQIGFVLPTKVPPCDVESFSRMAYRDTDQLGCKSWKTCVVLPFRSKLPEGNSINSIVKMFSDLHPSLLLFLHRLQCIVFRNMIDDSLAVMRKDILGDGIIKVSCGKDKMTWLVSSQKLQADTIHQKLRTDVVRRSVEITEVAVAFTLKESGEGEYTPQLVQQPVFAFLPLRNYGLKFILQGDFVLPSSREEVDGDSPWNQWLLSEIPNLFVDAERSFCSLPCFKETPGKAVTAYMSFVPLAGEVHGFFSCLPHTIISKLRMSNCLLLEGEHNQWVPPCKVLRGWTEQVRLLLPDSLLLQHLGLGFLEKDIVLPDSLARALGIVQYGPKILIQFMGSLCSTQNGLKLMGMEWLSSWLNELYKMLCASGQSLQYSGLETDVMETLRKLSFIPLLGGTYSSVEEGTIWLHSEASGTVFDGAHGLRTFPELCAKLRTVDHALLSAATHDMSVENIDNITCMLNMIGVQQLSGHEIVKAHILPAISDDTVTIESKNLMTDYLCFAMIHLQSSCPQCGIERDYLVSELRNKAFILTNHGFKRPAEVPIHFSQEFGNPINMSKLINVLTITWNEVDTTYLTHPSTGPLSSGLMNCRKFLQEIGITDFVHVVQVEKNLADILDTISDNSILERDLISPGLVARDWESHELVNLLFALSMNGDRESCKYMLEVLDIMWDDIFCNKVLGFCNFSSSADSKTFMSSFVRSILGVQWVPSSMDEKLHYPNDLFHDCQEVRLILGTFAPFAVPKVKSEKLLDVIGFKTNVSLDDALEILKVWRSAETPFKASLAQMTKFYSFIWDKMSTSQQKVINEFFSGAVIFVPYASTAGSEEMLSGIFLTLEEVYWSDPTGSEEKIIEIHMRGSSKDVKKFPQSKTLCNIYPGLHDFFVNECGVRESPSTSSYLQILKQLAVVALPSQAAKTIFKVFLKWADGLKSGLLNSEDIIHLKECLTKSECTVLPTVQDRWVSLHASLGPVCWCDDNKLGKRFKNLDNIDFLYFGNLNDNERGMLKTKVSILFKALGIPALSELVSRQVTYSDPVGDTSKALLVNWALPYAQRYMHSVHSNEYTKLKESGFDSVTNLEIIVVEKLNYRNVIKNYGIVSKKLYGSSCLLEGNILYTTSNTSSHKLFMELSSLFFDGKPDLYLANFLHMIRTMAESGSAKDQTEAFILNSQKVSVLPDDESIWSLSCLPSLLAQVQGATEEQTDLQLSLLENDENISIDGSKKQSTSASKYSSWPLSDWKTAPGVRDVEEKGADAKSEVSTLASFSNRDVSFDPVDLNLVSDGFETGPSGFSIRDRLNTGAPHPSQALLTGRLGEHIAFKYFSESLAKKNVRWVNEDNETGLPYDMVIGETEESPEYIEVKSTKSARKDWFKITMREWQFANEKGDSFSVAHVVLLGNNVARVSVYKNPVKLCYQGKLQLVVMMPKDQDFSIVS
ncbi:LOW QUALITY PROTEIN: protein NO VEIN-like [Rutidosis leptorrhynchoides]|uniref:LOW QUALITY PROTEIN: protein NO VEIN-like n=1 Tax=Rutidosis leptorrhynchoides TaxID=125765 RepID=UPI003A992793